MKSITIQGVHRRLCWVLCVLPLSLTGCTSLDVLNLLTGEPQSKAMTLSYGPSTRQSIDVYLPNAAASADPAATLRVQSQLKASQTKPDTAKAGRPLVIFFYGGAWSTGSKTDYRFIAKAFNEMGYVVAIPDYRLVPDVVYPEFLRDSASAVSLLIREAKTFGADPQRVILAGHSAGAYNAMMIALDQRWLGAGDRAKIRGVIGLASPVNFLPIQMPEAQRAFSWPNTPRDSQPIEHVSRGAPPMLLINAADDPLVDPKLNSLIMAERLRALGVYVEMDNLDGPLGLINHSRLVATLSPRFQFVAPTLQRAQRFIEHVTGQDSSKTATRP
jgi:acetyl esterase/lipase